MDKAAALLAALRAAAGLAGGRLEPTRVEALAAALGVAREELPALVTGWQKAGQVALAWSGVVEVLPEPPAPSSGGTTFNLQGATLGHGATIAGRDATGGTVNMTPEAAFGTLAAVLAKLQEVRPSLQGDAAEAADGAAKALKTPPSPDTPAEARRAWAAEAAEWFGRLLKAAPQVKAVAELGEKALKALGWG
jgi:hypothetical protein